MYDKTSWDEEPRKPRYEGAEVHYKGKRILFAVSPVKKWTPANNERLKIVKSFKPKETQPNGASLLPAGKRWMVAFTMQEGDEPLSTELTQMLTDFLKPT